MSEYKRFPYRQVFRYGFLVFFFLMVFVAPWLWKLYWEDYYQTNVDALNSSASYKADPGAAAAGTWHIEEQWPWVMLGAAIIFLFYLYIFWWSRPGNDPHRSSFD